MNSAGTFTAGPDPAYCRHCGARFLLHGGAVRTCPTSRMPGPRPRLTQRLWTVRHLLFSLTLLAALLAPHLAAHVAACILLWGAGLALARWSAPLTSPEGVGFIVLIGGLATAAAGEITARHALPAAVELLLIGLIGVGIPLWERRVR